MRLSEADPWGKLIAAKLRTIAVSNGAVAIDPVDYMCQLGLCPTLADDGLPRYCDGSHLSPDYVRNQITFLDSIMLIEEVYKPQITRITQIN